jgi:hypothetical protein
MKLKDRSSEHNICFSEDEAMGLIDIVLMYPGELSSDQRAAMLKLSDFCREFIRDRGDAPLSMGLSGLAAPATGYVA